MVVSAAYSDCISCGFALYVVVFGLGVLLLCLRVFCMVCSDWRWVGAADSLQVFLDVVACWVYGGCGLFGLVASLWIGDCGVCLRACFEFGCVVIG